MAKLKLKLSCMRAGKSTFLLQINHSFQDANKQGLLFTLGDRSGKGKITSRIGIEADAIIVSANTDLYDYISNYIENIGWIDYVLLDEGQFLKPEQVDQIARIVDDYGIDVYVFALKVDFRGDLFLGTKRLIEVADEFSEIETKSLCWCGRKAIFNVRVDENGNLISDGALKVIGDNYETLCREHARLGITKNKAKMENIITS